MRPAPALLLCVLTLAGCGMKGDLYESPPPTPAREDGEDEGERKTIPDTPAPGSAQ